MTEHPITPPPELVQQWGDATPWTEALTQAARWGADQELEACCEWFAQDWSDTETAAALRATRRPKPPSLKQQALTELDSLENMGACNADTIRRALEALPDE